MCASQVQIRRLPKPVIAQVAGYAVGGGHILHMMCDLTIAADNAVFGQTGPKVGSFDAGYGSTQMARLIGDNYSVWLACRTMPQAVLVISWSLGVRLLRWPCRPEARAGDVVPGAFVRCAAGAADGPGQHCRAAGTPGGGDHRLVCSLCLSVHVEA